jgi:predicted RNase H-like HicB family nuclease
VARSIARLAGWIQEVAMAHYVGILDGSGDTWGVRVPDLPGCHGGGDTAEAAITDAISAAREWAEHHNAKGVALPVSLRCVRSSVMAKWMCGRAKRR